MSNVKLLGKHMKPWPSSFFSASQSLFVFSSDVASFASPDDEIERLLAIAKQSVADIKPASAASLGTELHVGFALSAEVKGCPC